MPHSSGGGFHGGGFHGGGGFSGHHYGRGARSSPIISRFHYPGAHAWLYYTTRGVPHIVYSSQNITKTPQSAGPITYVILGIFAIMPIAFIALTANQHPQRVVENYSTTVVLDDGAGVFSPSEQFQLLSVFEEFRKASGVTPSIVTVNNGEWNRDFWEILSDKPYSLEDEAYTQYVDHFSDESHWLIVYSCDKGTTKGNWAFEGMQGDNTDGILFENVTNAFNEKLYNCLSGEMTVGESFIEAYNYIIPNLMKDSFYIDGGLIAFTIVWEIFVVSMAAITIKSQINSKDYAKAQKIENPDSIVMKQCKHCGASYYKGTVDRCPKCGRSVLMDDEFDGKF